MFNPSNQEPTQVEQLAANSEMALALFGQAVGADFSHIEDQIVAECRRYLEDHKDEVAIDPWQSAREYAEASGKGEARRIVELNSEEVFINRFGPDSSERAKRQIAELYESYGEGC